MRTGYRADGPSKLIAPSMDGSYHCYHPLSSRAAPLRAGRSAYGGGGGNRTPVRTLAVSGFHIPALTASEMWFTLRHDSGRTEGMASGARLEPKPSRPKARCRSLDLPSR